VDIAKGHITK